MKILFVGHVSVDYNIVRGVSEKFYGGAAPYGAIAAKRLGIDAAVLSKCAEADLPNFVGMLEEVGVQPFFLPSPASTSIRNVYPTENPDDRQSTMISRAASFDESDLERIVEFGADWVHITPLWLGEFPPHLFQTLRARVPLLACDAGGFVRAVHPDGSVSNCDMPNKKTLLAGVDVFKVDVKEAFALTGEEEPHRAIRAVHALGPKIVLYTHMSGVCAFDGRTVCESPFDGFTMEGRTGRGDTCTSSFLVAQCRGMGLQEATAFAAKVTSQKMQYRGPYRG